MSQRVWFDRAFELGIPVESYPELMERLRGTPARLEERVRDLRRGTLTHRPGARWSIQEHAGHLSDLETLWNSDADSCLRETSRWRRETARSRYSKDDTRTESPGEI